MSDIDLQTTIAKVIERLAQTLDRPEQEILERFYESDTYIKLKNPNTLLWTEGHPFICDRVIEEWEKNGR